MTDARTPDPFLLPKDVPPVTLNVQHVQVDGTTREIVLTLKHPMLITTPMRARIAFADLKQIVGLVVLQEGKSEAAQLRGAGDSTAAPPRIVAPT